MQQMAMNLMGGMGQSGGETGEGPGSGAPSMSNILEM